MSAVASWKDPSSSRDASVPQARLMVIPSSWPMTPVACRSKDSALAIHRPQHHIAAAAYAGCKPPSQACIALVVMMQVVVVVEA